MFMYINVTGAVLCAAVPLACAGLWCCCILAGVRGQLPTYALTRHLDLHSSWRPGYIFRDSPQQRAGGQPPSCAGVTANVVMLA
jgi:hypothetical protein